MIPNLENTMVEKPIIDNPWITLEAQKNGVTVQRKFGGLHTEIDENDRVNFCRVRYWYRELYPNNLPIKTVAKFYSLEDLPYSETAEIVDGVERVYAMQELKVLTGLIQLVGIGSIIGPARQTLENHIILPIDAKDGYPLRRDTREKFLKD